MAWLCVDKHGEFIFETKPIRSKKHSCWALQSRHGMCSVIKLPKGTIEKIIGKYLTWEDEPVKL